MSIVRLLLQRIALGLAAAWALLSAVFLLFAATDDWYLSRILASLAREGTPTEEIERVRDEYLGERALDQPLHEQYVDWLTDMFTLQWGDSFETGEAVFPMVTSAAATTASYVVPAIVLSMVLALGIGVYTAMRRGSHREHGVRGVTYAGLGLPNFWIGAVLLMASGTVAFTFDWRESFIPAVELPFFYETALPALLLTTTLVAAVASYARSYALQYASADLAKLVRAKGGGQVAVARHVVRNAAIPLVSLAFTETLALLALSVFVIEALFAIDGLGLLFYNAVWTRDLPVLLGGTLAVVAVGVLGNVTQDLAYSVLDPRVDTGTR